MTWEEISNFSNKNPPTGEICRSPELEDLYKKYCENLKSKGLKISEVIVERHFSEDDASAYCLICNNFPYDLDSSLEHLVLWLCPNSPLLSDEEIQAILRCELPGLNFIYWRNSLGNSSVPGVIHYQVIVQKRLAA